MWKDDLVFQADIERVILHPSAFILREAERLRSFTSGPGQLVEAWSGKIEEYFPLPMCKCELRHHLLLLSR